MAQLKPVAKKQVKTVQNPAKSPNFKPPNLDEFLPDDKKRMVSYMEGARYYSMNYYAFVKLAMLGCGSDIGGNLLAFEPRRLVTDFLTAFRQ